MPLSRLSLGCPALDELLGGGVEFSSMTSVFGPAGVGKTCFAIQASVSCIRSGRKVFYVDTEGGFSPERFEQIYHGNATRDVLLIEPKTFKEQEDAIMGISQMINDDVGLIVLDSLVTLYRLEMTKDTHHEVNRRLALQLSELSKISRERNIPIIITNQVYEDIEKRELELVSRDVVKYWAKCLLELRRTGKGRRAATIRKHRSRPEGEEAEFSITQNGIEDAKIGIFG